MPKTTLLWISNVLQSIQMILAASIGKKTMGWTARREVSSQLQVEPHPPTWVWLRLMSLAFYILLDAGFSTVHV